MIHLFILISFNHTILNYLIGTLISSRLIDPQNNWYQNLKIPSKKRIKLILTRVNKCFYYI